MSKKSTCGAGGTTRVVGSLCGSDAKSASTMVAFHCFVVSVGGLEPRRTHETTDMEEIAENTEAVAKGSASSFSIPLYLIILSFLTMEIMRTKGLNWRSL